MPLVALDSRPITSRLPISTIISKARECKKSPTNTLAAFPQVALAVALPRLRDELSTTSSWSSSATANAKPELEIYADDVKCAHGCAIGELDPMGLFYLQARGLAPADAKKLMLQAFVAGVFEGAVDEDMLIEAALKKLGELV